MAERFDREEAARHLREAMAAADIDSVGLHERAVAMGVSLAEATVRHAAEHVPDRHSRRPPTEHTIRMVALVLDDGELEEKCGLVPARPAQRDRTIGAALFGGTGFAPEPRERTDAALADAMARLGERPSSSDVADRKEVGDAAAWLLRPGYRDQKVVVAQLGPENVFHSTDRAADVRYVVPDLLCRLAREGVRVDHIVSAAIGERLLPQRISRFVDLMRSIGDYRLGVVRSDPSYPMPTLIAREGMGALIVLPTDATEIAPHRGLLLAGSGTTAAVDRLIAYGDVLRMSSEEPFDIIDHSSELVSTERFVELERRLALAESTSGDRFVLKHGFSDLTMPGEHFRSLLRKSRSGGKTTWVDKAMAERQRRTQQLNDCCDRFSAVDVIPRSALESYVRTGSYAPAVGAVLGVPADRHMVVEHLETVLVMLKRQPGFHVLIGDDEVLSGDHADELVGSSIMVKGALATAQPELSEWVLHFESWRLEDANPVSCAFETRDPRIAEHLSPLIADLRRAAMSPQRRAQTIAEIEGALEAMA